MDLEATASLTAKADRVHAVVSDLATYPDWLGIVFGAEQAPAHAGDAGPAWQVELGARVFGMPMTKRVRMVRTEHVAPELARFERVEHDDGGHSAWVLVAEVEAAGSGSVLTVRLHYGGTMPVPGIEKILRDEIDKGGERLERRLATSA